MTAEQAYEAALRQRLADRAALLLRGRDDVLALLAQAQADIVAILAQQPSDYQRWQLGQVMAQIKTVLDAATANAGAKLDAAVRAAWQQGEDFIDKPLEAAGLGIEAQMPLLDASLLASLRNFGIERMKDISAEAAGQISRELSLVTLGGKTPFEAIQAITRVLQLPTVARAQTIVRTAISQTFALAQQQRGEQAAAVMANSAVHKGYALEKQWRRSGKIHSRWNHDAIDGQRVALNEAFKLPTLAGVIDMLHPHDPSAPAEEVINCGCVALPRVKGWAVATPGARPFSDLELARDARKAALDQAAQKAGLR